MISKGKGRAELGRKQDTASSWRFAKRVRALGSRQVASSSTNAAKDRD